MCPGPGSFRTLAQGVLTVTRDCEKALLKRTGATHLFAMGVSNNQKSWEDQDIKKRDREEKILEQDAWLTKSAKILSDVKEWRKAHPKATFVEIEDEVHRRMMQLEAQLLQDAAQESASRTWGKETGGEAPRCPGCQVPLQARGQQTRTFQGNGGESVTLLRTYGTCPQCGERFFPPR